MKKHLGFIIISVLFLAVMVTGIINIANKDSIDKQSILENNLSSNFESSIDSTEQDDNSDNDVLNNSEKNKNDRLLFNSKKEETSIELNSFKDLNFNQKTKASFEIDKNNDLAKPHLDVEQIIKNPVIIDDAEIAIPIVPNKNSILPDEAIIEVPQLPSKNSDSFFPSNPPPKPISPPNTIKPPIESLDKEKPNEPNQPVQPISPVKPVGPSILDKSQSSYSFCNSCSLEERKETVTRTAYAYHVKVDEFVTMANEFNLYDQYGNRLGVDIENIKKTYQSIGENNIGNHIFKVYALDKNEKRITNDYFEIYWNIIAWDSEPAIIGEFNRGEAVQLRQLIHNYRKSIGYDEGLGSGFQGRSDFVAREGFFPKTGTRSYDYDSSVTLVIGNNETVDQVFNIMLNNANYIFEKQALFGCSASVLKGVNGVKVWAIECR